MWWQSAYDICPLIDCCGQWRGGRGLDPALAALLLDDLWPLGEEGCSSVRAVWWLRSPATASFILGFWLSMHQYVCARPAQLQKLRKILFFMGRETHFQNRVTSGQWGTLRWCLHRGSQWGGKLSNGRAMVALDLETPSRAGFGGDSVAALTQLSLSAWPSSSVPWVMAICLH